MEQDLLPSDVFKGFIGEVYGVEFPSPTHIGHNHDRFRKKRGLVLLGS